MNMKGDFSRVTFDPAKHFTSVLMQQGRVQLDADWNEQAAILLWQIRTLARGVIGEFGASGANSFLVTQTDKTHLQVAKGLYFVHGIAVENGSAFDVPMPPATPPAANGKPVFRQGDAAGNQGDAAGLPPSTRPPGQDGNNELPTFGVFLVVWERLVTWRDDPSIREIALGDGIDTALRRQVRWSIVVRGEAEGEIPSRLELPALKVGLDGGPKSTEACNISPDARYRGAGNHLYRVEIHNTFTDAQKGVSFKWSRENASLVFPVTKVSGTTLYLNSAGRDDRLSIHPGDYLEFESTDSAWDKALPLALVRSVSADDASVTVDAVPDGFKVTASNRATVRRWDHSQQNSTGLTPLAEGKPISLENGLNITFEASAAERSVRGDYWLIPARTGVAWEPPAGALNATTLEHYLAPLASFSADALGNVSALTDQRSVIETIAKKVAAASGT